MVLIFDLMSKPTNVISKVVIVGNILSLQLLLEQYTVKWNKCPSKWRNEEIKRQWKMEKFILKKLLKT